MADGATRTATEQAAMAKAGALDATLVELARRGMALLDQLLPAAPVVTIEHAELVARQALVQARNTLRAAWLLLFDGFEVQSLALARLITEYLVLAWYARSGADVEPWLEPEAQPPSTGEQLKALERAATTLPELGALVTKSRRLLHRLAHQDPIAFAFAYRLEDGGPSFFRAAGVPDALSLRRGGEFLLPLTLLALQTATDASTPHHAAFEDAVSVWFYADHVGTGEEPS